MARSPPTHCWPTLTYPKQTDSCGKLLVIKHARHRQDKTASARHGDFLGGVSAHYLAHVYPMHVQERQRLPQVVLGVGHSDHPIQAPIGAAGLPHHALAPDVLIHGTSPAAGTCATQR